MVSRRPSGATIVQSPSSLQLHRPFDLGGSSAVVFVIGPQPELHVLPQPVKEPIPPLGHVGSVRAKATLRINNACPRDACDATGTTSWLNRCRK